MNRIHGKPRSLTLQPTITAFERSPDQGRGLARDMRVRCLTAQARPAFQRAFAAQLAVFQAGSSGG